MQRRMRLDVVDEVVDIVGQSPYSSSKYLAKFLNCWNNTIIGRLKEFGYKNMWLTWMRHNLSSRYGRERLHLSIKFKPKKRCGFYVTTTGKSGLG